MKQFFKHYFHEVAAFYGSLAEKGINFRLF